ncbi:MAG: endonuclease/exonuclease/phosphatase family protein [Caldilineaceae bacterium]
MATWLYSGLLLAWFGLHWLYDDQIWWLALLNAFAPWFFLPLVILIPLQLVLRSKAVAFTLLSPLLLFLFLYGQLFVPTQLRTPARHTSVLRVMSFNIWGGSHAQETVQVIADNQFPELVALQELPPDMADLLVKQFSTAYPYRLLNAGYGNHGMGILSRYPFTVLDATGLADPAWAVQVVRVAAPGHSFTFYNVHPHGTNILLYWQEGSSVRENVEQSYQARLTFAHKLLDDISKRNGPLLVAGDFNSTEQSAVYRQLTTCLFDAHRVAGWGFGHTFPAYQGSFHGIPIPARLMRIDMIFYSNGFQAIDQHISPKHGESDHLPIVATLQWQVAP